MTHLRYLLLLIILTAVGLTAVAPVSATTWVIKDEYIGTYETYGGTSYARNDGDVIAANSLNAINEFDIDYITVDIDDGNITVTVATDYTTNIAGYGTDYGDLFISTGTDGWEYVFDTSTMQFYSTEEGTYLDSNYFLSSSYSANAYRSNQLVQFSPDSTATDLAEGEGSFERTQIDGNWVLIYSGFNLSDLGIDDPDAAYDLAFRWTMTCANDIIEADISNPVPEPETMVMFGLGLLGLCAVSRRRFSAVRIRSKKQQ